MVRFGRKKESAERLVERLSSLSVSEEMLPGEMGAQVRLEDGSRVFCNPPSGHLPRFVLEELHALEDSEYRRFLENKESERRRKMIGLLEAKKVASIKTRK